MGVKGLQAFLDRCCPEACVTVDLREMAARHSASTHTRSSPTIVVDGMACLCHWYSCKDWVCGGQWREYMDILKRWVDTFSAAGIRLVFFFDGVVEEQKRQEWVKRRLRVNGEVYKIFSYIKAHGEQPGGNVFSLPSGLATFTRFALRLLGQEVFCSTQEADYEIASYAHRQGCMGILGQDTDFIIYDSAPYLSVTKLNIDSLTTVLYDRGIFCRALGLTVSQLPLLACLLGNDVVSEERMHHIRNNAMAAYRNKHHAPHSGASREQMIFAVSQLVSTLCCGGEEETVRVPQSLHLSASDRQLLQRGICSYVLTGLQHDVFARSSDSAFEKHVSPEVLKACREKHVAAEGFMVYNVICEGVVECSNSLEDEEDSELLPQAVVFKPCRQHIYSLLLPNKHDGSTEEPPAIREWFVYPGNPLKEPDIVQPVPISFQCSQPTLDVLWFSPDPEVSALRLMSFFSVFGCQEFSELYGAVEDSLLAALCLITYIVLQVPALSVEDVDAYLSQAVCLRLKSPEELQQLKLPFISGRAVQLGSLYVRGLSHLLGANCASGCPLPSVALMPWHSFDGRLFHSKYLLAHGSSDNTVLLDNDSSCLTQFRHLREKLLEACRRRGRVLQSRPRASGPLQSLTHTPEHRYTERPADGPPGGGEDWRQRGEMAAGRRSGRGWRHSGGGRSEIHQNQDKQWERGGHRGGGGDHFYFSPHFSDGGPQNLDPPSRQLRGRRHQSRGRYRLAPRWSRPPPPGT